MGPPIMIECTDAGLVPYERALKWQKTLSGQRRRQEIGDRLLLLEHPPVYTLGRRDASDDFLVPGEWITANGIEIHKTDRGGRATYHGPGQLVGYPIFRLQETIPGFVRKIEETLIRLLNHFHLEGHRDPRYPGVWLEERKIAALGLHVERGITTHGFALNVHCDLKPFRYIRPCGIPDREVTSLEKELGWQPSMRDVKHTLLAVWAAVFKTNVTVGGISPSQPE